MPQHIHLVVYQKRICVRIQVINSQLRNLKATMDSICSKDETSVYAYSRADHGNRQGEAQW